MTQTADQLRQIADEIEQNERGHLPDPDDYDRINRVIAHKEYPSGREVTLGCAGYSDVDNPLYVFENGELVGSIFMDTLANHVEDS